MQNNTYAVNIAQRYSAHCYNVAQTLQALSSKTTRKVQLYALQVKASKLYVTFAQSSAKFSATRNTCVQYTSNIQLAACSKAQMQAYAAQLRNTFTSAQLQVVAL